MRKIIGIVFICLMLMLIMLTPIISALDTKSENYQNNDEIPSGIWFIRGSFKYLDEDEEYIYLKAISAKLRGFGNGAAVYHLFFCPIKISKPFYGFLPTGLFPLPGFGLCRQWDYHDMVTIDKLGNGPDLQVGLYTSISFGLNYDGLQIYVKNIGDETAHNVNLIDLSIEGKVLYNNRVTEWGRDIEPGSSLTDTPDTMFIGIGVFTATMTVTCDENITCTGTGNGFILGMFIFVP